MKLHDFETFRELSSYAISELKRDEPNCFNGEISYRKYRIAVELVDEPVEVLQERIQKLWDECENHHHWKPLQAAAKSLGMARLDFATQRRHKK